MAPQTEMTAIRTVNPKLYANCIISLIKYKEIAKKCILRFRAIVWRIEALTSGTYVDESAPDPVSGNIVLDVNEITDSCVQYQSC